MNSVQLFQKISVVYLVAYFLITISFTGMVVCIIHNMIKDRESGIKETFSIMQMKTSAYTLSYFISQGIFAFITTTIVSFTFLLANGNTYDTMSKPLTFFLALLAFSFSSMSLAMVVSTFFKERSVSFSVAIWMMLLPYSICVYCIKSRLDDTVNGV